MSRQVEYQPEMKRLELLCNGRGGKAVRSREGTGPLLLLSGRKGDMPSLWVTLSQHFIKTLNGSSSAYIMEIPWPVSLIALLESLF